MNACGFIVSRSAIVAAVAAVILCPSRVAACTSGFQDAGGGVCTATFVLTGAPESIVLPAGTTVISATVSGAAGGPSLEEQVDPFGGAPSPGGNGGRQSAVIPVVPGATLTVVVGEAGTGGVLAPPGYGGYGGGGHATSRYGGNGGGGSYVFDTTDPNNVLVLAAAGGGGGGGYDYNPVVLGRGDQHADGGHGSGAAPAGSGAAVHFCCDGTPPSDAGGGAGATPDGGGLGGHPTLPQGYAFGQADGDPGSGPAIDQFNFGVGGNTHNGCCYYTGWAGGGGGGYYGGGGGGNIEAQLEGGGGGGGAGYVVPEAISSSSQTGVQVGDGQVTISYYTGGCDPSCATCSGPGPAQCATCGLGLVLVNGACVTGSTSTTSTTVAPPTTSTTGGASTSTTVTVVTSPSTSSTTLAPICAAAPIASTSCRLAAARASSVQIKNDVDKHKDLLKWKWTKGAATAVGDFADPVGGSATYHLCVYDASGTAQPLMDVPLTPGGTCGTAPCWKVLGTTGFAYKNKDGTPLGITTAKLKAGEAGKASVQMKGKGALLPTTPLPLTTPVTVQLVIRDGATTACWQASYTTVTKNTASQFGAKGP